MRHRSKRSLVSGLALGLVAVAAAACGGGVSAEPPGAAQGHGDGGAIGVNDGGARYDGSDATGGEADAVAADGKDSGVCPPAMPSADVPCAGDGRTCTYPGPNCGSPGGGSDVTFVCTCTASGWSCTGGC